MNDRVLFRVVTTTPSVATETAATQGVRGASRKGSETAAYSLTGADPRGKWASFVVGTNAHWFLELKGFSSAQITHF
jgi:hypothetical protein